MKNDTTFKSSKDNGRLPSLHKSSSRNLLNQNSPPSKFLFQQKSLNRFYQHPKNIQETKAHNFLNQNVSICSPSLIMNVSDCVKKEYGKSFENNKQFSEENLIKSNFFKNFNPQKENIASKSFHSSNMTQGKFYQKDTKCSFERQEVLNLAKWIDTKLQEFNKKSKITVDEIIDYKQHILNYGLGKIIDSVKKKSREEGDLLKILWENSFKIFQKVLEVISNSIYEKEKSFLEDQNEAKQIFNTNLQHLTTQNHKISQELDSIYEKMKKVIIWNKRLRKQKKALHIQNRILEYRNETYSQALEETIGMFLKAIPEPTTVSFAKKIIEKLARQKRRKKKNFEREEVEQDFKIQAKQLVTSWLRRNGFNQMDDDDIDPIIHLTNEQKLELTNIDDETKINQVDIYEYFKLLDIGVQTDNPTKNTACQYDIDLTVKMQAKATFTENLYKKNFEIQVSPIEVTFNEDAMRKQAPKKRTSKIMRSNDKKKSNVSKFSEKSDKVKDKIQSKENLDTKGDDDKTSKFNKNGVKIMGKDGKMSLRKNQDKEKNKDTSANQLIDERYYEKDFTVISEKKSDEFNFESDDDKNYESGQYRISISKLNGDSKARFDFSKHQQFETRGRQDSFKDFTDYGLNEEQNGATNNMKELWKLIQSKKINNSEESDSRLSMNFIKIDTEDYTTKRLEKKLFTQVYEQGKFNSRSQEKQRQKIFQTVVRCRSFYKKGKVMFENSNDFEQSKETKVNLYKSYLNYNLHRKKTMTEIAAEDDEKVDRINRKMAIPSNLAKSKTLAVAKEMFKQLADTCKKTKKQPPKNKQYFNNSLSSITKNVSALVQDYLRQVKRQKDDIQIDFQKTYYPLHTILMDKMNCKYGLKDISEKKIKDFLEKILTFASVSEKVSLFSLLFGMETEGVGADQLLIYLKCLVYLQKKQPTNNSIHILKETNPFEKVSTDHEVVQENIDKILKDFFDKEGAELAKKQVFQYLEENSKFLNIEKIAQIVIRAVLRRKQIYKKDALFLYKLCSRGKNIFNNFYKVLKIYNNYNGLRVDFQSGQKEEITRSQGKRQINIQTILKEFIKRSDMIDQIYGKSISFDRFLTAFMVAELPREEEVRKTFGQISIVFDEKYNELGKIKSLNKNLPVSMVKYSQEGAKFLEEAQKKWQGKVGQKVDEESWDWSMSKTVTDRAQNHLRTVLGKLGIINNQIENFFFSLEQKTESNKE